MPSYSNQRHRFALKLSIWKTKTKNLPDGPRYLKLSNAKYILKCRMKVYQVIFKLLAYVALP